MQNKVDNPTNLAYNSSANKDNQKLINLYKKLRELSIGIATVLDKNIELRICVNPKVKNVNINTK